MTTQPRPSDVVVGYDFSAASDPALDQALKLASHMLPARVHVLTVLSNDLTSHRPTYIEAARLDSALERLAARTGLPPREDLQIFTHARIGSPSAEILELAHEVHAELIVVGTHRRQGIKRLALGSVAEAVILGAHCPVHVALPTQYPEVDGRALTPEPPCPLCVQTRTATAGKSWWCEDHSRPYQPPRRYDITNRSIVEMRPDEWILW
jgi:nucleotide-binding universal stress UspA family protein